MKNIFSHKCPSCGITDAFENKKVWLNVTFPNMKKNCNNCDYSFYKEPGFYVGAMYISYGLTIAESILIFTVAQFFFDNWFSPKVFGIILLFLILLMRFNFKSSRMIWLYIFK